MSLAARSRRRVFDSADEQDDAALSVADQEQERMIGAERHGVGRLRRIAQHHVNQGACGRLRVPFVDLDDGLVQDVLEEQIAGSVHPREVGAANSLATRLAARGRGLAMERVSDAIAPAA